MAAKIATTTITMISSTTVKPVFEEFDLKLMLVKTIKHELYGENSFSVCFKQRMLNLIYWK